jgi:hypothetical protein
MQLHGTTEGNLISAVRSATRLRGRPVHADTLKYWSDLLRHARSEFSSGAAFESEPLARLITQLEQEIVQHQPFQARIARS